MTAVAHRVIVDEHRYYDWYDLSPALLYAWLEQGIRPRIEAPAPKDFLGIYAQQLERYDEVLSIHVSGQLSRTVKHAHEAVADLKAHERITVLDAASCSVGLAEAVLQAAQLSKEGASKETLLTTLKHIRETSSTVIVPRSTDWFFETDMGTQAAKQRPLLAIDGGRSAHLGSVFSKRLGENLTDHFMKRFPQQALHLSLGIAADNRVDIESFKHQFEQSGLAIVRGRVQQLGAFLSCQYGTSTLAIAAYPSLSGSLIFE